MRQAFYIFLCLQVILLSACSMFSGDPSADQSADESLLGSGNLSLAPSDFSKNVKGEVALPKP